MEHQVSFFDKRCMAPHIKESLGPKRKKKKKKKQCAEINKMEFWEGVSGYEACISQLSRQKTGLKSRQHIMSVIIQYLSRDNGATQLEKFEN